MTLDYTSDDEQAAGEFWAVCATQKYFIGNNFETIYLDMLRMLKENPEYTPSPRGVGSREITNLTFELTDPRDRMVWNKAREVNYEFAMKFFIWMVNGDTDFSYVSGANKHAVEFIDKPKDDKAMPTNFSTAYGPRILKQLPFIIEELTRDPDSRRCVIHVLNEDDLNMLGTDTKEEYPCTDSFTWLIRDGHLNMYTHMRSNNMVLTLCYDVFNMTMLHEYLWKALKAVHPALELGIYHHNIVSAHYFEREQPLVDKILADAEDGRIGVIQKKAPPQIKTITVPAAVIFNDEDGVEPPTTGGWNSFVPTMPDLKVASQ
jgi:thymidylate synthase